MKKMKLVLLLTIVLASVSCSYIPVPLPPKFTLASEQYVDDRVSEHVDSLIAGMLNEKVDSVVVEITTLVEGISDSLMKAQDDVFSLLEESKALQSKLDEELIVLKNSIDENTQDITQIISDLEYYSTVQDQLYTAVRSVPAVSLETILNALTNYRPKPLLKELTGKPEATQDAETEDKAVDSEESIEVKSDEPENIPLEEAQTDSTATP